MQPSDVTMYGRDYSAREFSDQEFRLYMRDNPRERPVNFLGRYIGYPGNRKCISAYPGMYQHHLQAGRPSFLFHQIGYTDMEGGFNAGRSDAQTAKADAESARVGWRGESHIVACMDRFYAKQGYRTLTAGDLREYMRGFRSVLGDRAGFYGFFDSMRDAINERWASFYVQCGARSAHIPGIHAWQENNYQPLVFGTATDILELYCHPSYAFGDAPVTDEEIRKIAQMAADLTYDKIMNTKINRSYDPGQPPQEGQTQLSWVIAAGDGHLAEARQERLEIMQRLDGVVAPQIDYTKLAAELHKVGVPTAQENAVAFIQEMKKEGN